MRSTGASDGGVEDRTDTAGAELEITGAEPEVSSSLTIGTGGAMCDRMAAA